MDAGMEQKQTQNLVETDSNSIFSDSLTHLKDYVIQWDKSEKEYGRYFLTLVSLTIQNLEKGVLNKDNEKVVGFSKVELIEGAFFSDSMDEIEKRKSNFNSRWKTLLDNFQNTEEGLTKYLLDHEARFRFIPDKIEGGGAGNPTRYFLRPVELSPADISENPKMPDLSVPLVIEYYPEEIIKKGFWVNFLEKGLPTRGGLHLSMLFLALVLIIGGGFLIFLLLPAVERIGRLAQFAVFLGLLYLGWKWLKRYVEYSIVSAPDIFQGPYADILLEKRGESKADRKVYLVKYTGQCPICQKKVRAVDGGNEFAHRIVGRCDNSPQEHVFSFDHVTMSGRFLR